MIDDRVVFYRIRNKKTGFSKFYIDGKRVEESNYYREIKDYPRLYHKDIKSTRSVVKYYQERCK